MRLFDSYIARTGLDKKDYQYDAVKWCLQREKDGNEEGEDNQDKGGNQDNKGGLIADEMGLGKTIMMIGTFVSNMMTRTLIVLPVALMDQWVKQIKATTGHSPLVYYGRQKSKITLLDLHRAKIVITSYGTISLPKQKQMHVNKEKHLLHFIRWNRVVFDEAHHLRNRKTSRFIGAKRLSAKIVWLISGTPVQNKLSDLKSLCSILRIPYKTPIGHYIIKRTKSDVNISLPLLSYNLRYIKWQSESDFSRDAHSALKCLDIPVDASNVVSNVVSSYFGSKGVLCALTKAKQCCVMPSLLTRDVRYLVKKTKTITPLAQAQANSFIGSSSKLDIVLSTILERKTNARGKLIFCQFKKEIDLIAHALSHNGMNVRTLDARTKHADRSKILDMSLDALVLQIQTGCEGLNLQDNYSEIYFVSPHWNPAVEAQAIARCHRIGQKNEVCVFRFIMDNFHFSPTLDLDLDPIVHPAMLTLDKYVSIVQNKKRDMIQKIIQIQL